MRKSWKPSKSQAREFAEKMTNDADFKKNYEDKKNAKETKRRATSKFDYATAGGMYVPTIAQYNKANELLANVNLIDSIATACREVVFGFTCKAKINHDNIHIINEIIRQTK